MFEQVDVNGDGTLGMDEWKVRCRLRLGVRVGRVELGGC